LGGALCAVCGDYVWRDCDVSRFGDGVVGFLKRKGQFLKKADVTSREGDMMNNKGFMGLIGLVFTVMIIGVLAYFIFPKYFGESTGMDQQTKNIAQQSGIDTTSQSSILESTKNRIKELEAMQNEQAKKALGE
jgi:hypothetical protein